MMNNLSSRDIDTKDRSILRVLQKDGRISNTELAERLSLSPAACHRRTKRLEAIGAIRQYAALLDPRVAGKTQSVFVQITLQGQENQDLEAFEREVVKCPALIECYLMTGTYDYLLHVVVKDAEEYEYLHRHVLTRLPQVDRLTSSFALRQVRKTTELPLED